MNDEVATMVHINKYIYMHDGTRVRNFYTYMEYIKMTYLRIYFCWICACYEFSKKSIQLCSFNETVSFYNDYIMLCVFT